MKIKIIKKANPKRKLMTGIFFGIIGLLSLLNLYAGYNTTKKFVTTGNMFWLITGLVFFLICYATIYRRKIDDTQIIKCDDFEVLEKGGSQ